MRKFTVIAGAAFALVSVPAAAQSVALSCGQAAQTLEGDAGTSITVQCPPGCNYGSVWGTDVYSDDSDICAAARHAGALLDSGETVITIAPGQPSYLGSNRNGVQTSDWGSWERSFTFDSSMVIDCSFAAQWLEGEFGTVRTVTCPPGCDQSGSAVWGSNVYTDDSSVCVAAIHAGAISASGGVVDVEIVPGLETHPASTQNGITTSEWGTWTRSFQFRQD